MKKLLSIIILAAAVICFFGIKPAMADFIQPLDQVAFWVYDDIDQNGSVTLNINTSGSGVLQFRTGALDWADFSSPQQIVTTGGLGGDNVELVWLRLRDPLDNDGSLTFQGDPDDTVDGFDLYNSVIINWSGSISYASAAGDDNLAPVPLPPAALMFFSGLLGLCGIRRFTDRS